MKVGNVVMFGFEGIGLHKLLALIEKHATEVKTVETLIPYEGSDS